MFRGAHGALWAGEANAWDRVLLAAEALAGKGIEARIVPGEPPRLAYRAGEGWTTVRLDGEAAAETGAAPPAGAVAGLRELAAKHPDRVHWLVPTFVLEAQDGKTKRLTGNPDQLAAWVHEPVVVTAQDGKDGVFYGLRIGPVVEEAKPGLKFEVGRGFGSGPVGKLRRVALELTHKFKDKTAVWQRELFDARNTPKVVPGHDAARAGDRYAIVVAAGPLIPEVLETRAKMLGSEKHTPLKEKIDRDLVFLGVKYQVDSDKHTSELAERTKVEVAWTTPRITLAASEPTAKHVAKPKADEPPPGLSLDALADQVEAKGKRAREFHLARGLANDVIETRVLFEVAKQPVISASTVLSRFKAQTPETPERRLTQILNEAKRILSEEPIGTKLRLTALLPRGAQAEPKADDAKPPSLIVERAASGLVLHGVAVNEAIKKGKVSERFRWDPGQSAPFGGDAVALALAADGLLADQLRRPNYLLKLEVLSGWPVEPLPLTAGSVLRYRAQHDGKKYSVTVLVSLKDGVPGGMWFTAPQGEAWVDLFPRQGSRVGEVAGRWPEILSSTPIGPAVESFLAPSGAGLKGEAATVRVAVANQVRDVSGVKIGLSQPAPFLEVKSGDRWYAATFKRSKGLLDREGDLYRVHYLGATPTDEEQVPRDRCRPLEPVQAQIDGQWRFANLLEKKGDDNIVHLCGDAEATTHKVPKERVRLVRLVEAQHDGKWRPAHLLESKEAKHQVRLLDDKGEKAEWLPGDRVRTWDTPPAKNAHAIVLTSGQLPLLLHWQNGDTSLTLDTASPVVLGRTVDAET
ncbi:MAG: hypothetical protein HYS13_20630, partial [Planctomycetia bacterium]|nr:hypothetical protein [Planctomycetia bacterium]